MEQIVSAALELLTSAGIHAIHGFDGRDFPVLDAPMVAVSMENVTYRPICAGNLLGQRAGRRALGFLAEGTMLLEVYDDFRHGVQSCTEVAAQAAGLCTELPEVSIRDGIQVAQVRYEPDYDCFCCKVSANVRVIAARVETLS